MSYKEMNLYDIASVLLNLLHDKEMRFGINFNGRDFSIMDIHVEPGKIVLEVVHPGLTLVD